MKEKIVGIVEKIGDRVESMNQVEESTDVVYRVTKVKEDNTEKTRVISSTLYRVELTQIISEKENIQTEP